MFRLFPDLDEDLLLNLFHKGAHAQWTSRDVDWDDPLELDEDQCRSLAHLLTPVYLGEQSAMLGASSVLPQMAEAGETTAQVYLCSFMMDEARHFEALTRLYHRLDQHPLGIREMPEMLRYHHRLRQGDRADWVWGILISDLFAKNFYQMWSKAQPNALFGKMSGRILLDESRHQAFADHYLTRAISHMAPQRVKDLRIMRDELLFIMQAMNDNLREDADRVNLDGTTFLEHLAEDIGKHAKRIGLDGSDGDPDGDGGKRPMVAKTIDLDAKRAHHHRGRPTHGPVNLVVPGSVDTDCGEACDTCVIAALCHSRLMRAVAK